MCSCLTFCIKASFCFCFFLHILSSLLMFNSAWFCSLCLSNLVSSCSLASCSLQTQVQRAIRLPSYSICNAKLISNYGNEYDTNCILRDLLSQCVKVAEVTNYKSSNFVSWHGRAQEQQQWSYLYNISVETNATKREAARGNNYVVLEHFRWYNINVW